MSEIDDKPMTLKEATTEQPESTDPAYLAWVNEKIRLADKDHNDPAKWHTVEEVLESLDLED